MSTPTETLIASIDRGQPLVVELHEDGDITTVYAAELFILQDGIGWCDAGWQDTPGYPYHRLEGPIGQH